MALSNELITQFAKVTTHKETPKKESAAYGTIVKYNDSMYVRLDGSDQLTPYSRTTNVEEGERVSVTIKNHRAIVTGNMSSPSARTSEVEGIAGIVDEHGNIITQQDNIITQLNNDINQQGNTIKEINSNIEIIESNVNTNLSDITTIKSNIETINSDVSTIASDVETLNSTVKTQESDISTIKSNINTVNSNLETINSDVDIYNSSFQITDGVVTGIKGVDTEWITTDQLEADHGEITKLDTKYANIDFSNIGEAAVEKLFSDSGIIADLVMSEGHVTGRLVGVTIIGDLIEAGTLKADKLVMLGTDGLYYKLNYDGTNITGEQTAYNSLNGSIITAHTITAEKVNVDDLVAFNATIGGFNITDNSIYSGVKSSADNTTHGIYMDKDGQMAFGDANNYVKFYKDTDGTYKLAISAQSIKIGGSSKNIEETIEELRDEITTNLRIDSSRGTVFKNNAVSTVLSAVIYRGSQRITDIIILRSVMGASAYLQWKWQRLDDETFGVISASDSRIGNDGFTLTLTPADVDTKVTFMCELIV